MTFFDFKIDSHEGDRLGELGIKAGVRISGSTPYMAK